MRKRGLALLIIVAGLVSACTPSALPTPTTAAFASLGPVATSTPTITPISYPLTATPTAITSRGTVAASMPTATPAPYPLIPIPSPSPQSAIPWDDWSPQEAALLPAARGDLALLDHPTHYRLDLTLDMTGPRLRGHADVLYTNNEDVPLSALYFRLFPNMDEEQGGGTEIEQITLEGEQAQPQFELGRTALQLPLEPPLAPGAAVEVGLDFQVTVPRGAGGNYGAFAYQQGILSLAHFYPFVPVYDDEGWNVELAPTFGDIIYADVSLYDVTLTAPAEMVVAATGATLSVEAHDDGTATWRFASGPARDVNIVLSAEYEVARREVDGIMVNSYYLPEDAEGGQAVLDFAAEALRIFGQRFGPYPYTELDVVATPTSAAGIEYPGLVVIAERLYDDGNHLEWVVAHEVAHQWWYNVVGNDQVDEPWLDEALVQYVTSLYWEDRYGKAVADHARQNLFWDRYEQVRKEGRDRAVAGPVASFEVEDYGPIVYAKGPLFFHHLRELVGDLVFDDILRAYFQQHRYKIATPESFLAVAEKVSGRDLGALYQQWILTASVP